MKLLLVNSNPVVSRLTALSARKESVELDEIKDISELKNSDYSIVFVDSESYTEELATVLKNSGISRRVLFYTQDEEERPELFNFSILKPFLPSEVSAILRESKLEQDNKKESASTQHLNLDELISDKKDDLEPLGIISGEIEEKSEKSEPIEKLEVVEEKEKKKEKKEKIEKEEKREEKEDIIDFELNELPPFEEKIEEIVPVVTSIEEEKPVEKSDEKLDIMDSELFELDSSKDNSSDSELFSIDTKSSSDAVLDLDTQNSDELDLESIEIEIEEKKIEDKSIVEENIIEEKVIAEKKIEKKEDETTAVLDKNGISNIKSLLEDNSELNDNLSLDDFMSGSAPMNKDEKQEIKSEKLIEAPKKRKKRKKSKKAGSKVIIDSLGSLPVDDLRRLLLGAKVKITIKFPKE